MSPRSKLLGDGLAHGLAGGAAVVATPTPQRGEHAFDHAGLCQCGVRRKISSALGGFLYQGKHGGGWTRTRPVCSVVWQ